MSTRLSQLEKLLALEPTDAFVLYGLAQEHAKLGHTDIALHFFDRCLATDSGYCYAYYHKARTLAAASRVDEAIAATRAGIEAARRVADAKALGELSTLLDELT